MIIDIKKYLRDLISYKKEKITFIAVRRHFVCLPRETIGEMKNKFFQGWQQLKIS